MIRTVRSILISTLIILATIQVQAQEQSPPNDGVDNTSIEDPTSNAATVAAPVPAQAPQNTPSSVVPVTQQQEPASSSSTTSTRENDNNSDDQQNPPPSTEPPGWEARLAPVLPTLSLSGSSKGDSEIKGGIDLVYGFDENWDLAASPTFSVASADGLANLFKEESTGNSGNTTWSVGVTINFIELGLGNKNKKDEEDMQMKNALNICAKKCKSDLNNLDKNDKEFCEKSKTFPDPSKPDSLKYFSQKDLCKKGLKYWLAYDKKRVMERGFFSNHVISAGISGGANRYTFLDSSNNDDGLLSDKTVTKGNAKSGLVWTWVSTDKPLTFELPVNYSLKYTPQDTIAKWCTPAGDVARDTSDLTDSAETCKERILGAPTRSDTIWAATLIGFVAKPNGIWRFSLGPTFSYEIKENSRDKYAIGFEAPFYLNFLSAPSEYTGDYKGIIRLIPAFAMSHDSTGWERQISIIVQLLGQRTLFGRALDWP